MKIKLLVRILLSSFILSTLAAVPSEINYQGLITDSDGDPIESATNSVAVNLYQVETGGTAVYTQSFTQVASDANGIYSIQIGGASLQSVLEANNELWLELIINEQTLTPRQEINSVPYALVAKSANRLINASDSSISGDLSVSGNTLLERSLHVTDNLQVAGAISTTGSVNSYAVSAQELNVSTVYGNITFNGYDNNIRSHYETRFEGNRVRFDNYGGVDFDTDVEFTSTVTVPTPTEDNEVANKAYADSVVPSGGLIAWPSANMMPDGWSNAMLSSPMPNYIWIRKD